MLAIELVGRLAFNLPQEHLLIFADWLWGAAWYSSMTRIADMTLCGRKYDP